MREDLIVFEAARLCYELGLSQREVAKTLGVSPATLSRLLKKAKDMGIVSISVQSPEEFTRSSKCLSEQMILELRIDEVILVPASSKADYMRKELGYASARWMQPLLNNDLKIGLSGGRSISEMIPFLKNSNANVRVIQLMGGVSSTGKKIQADEIVRNAATILGGTSYVIHGPAIFPDEIAFNEFLKSPIIRDVSQLFDNLDVAIVGIGTLNPDSPLMQCGFINESEVQQLHKQGCVGEICGRFFDEEGKECNTTLASRTLAIRLEQLARTPKVCLVGGGIEKATTILAACKAGIPKTLITDIATVRELVTNITY